MWCIYRTDNEVQFMAWISLVDKICASTRTASNFLGRLSVVLRNAISENAYSKSWIAKSNFEKYIQLMRYIWRLPRTQPPSANAKWPCSCSNDMCLYMYIYIYIYISYVYIYRERTSLLRIAFESSTNFKFEIYFWITESNHWIFDSLVGRFI